MTLYYHATPASNVASILRRGIRPSKGRWGENHETPRIYLSNDSNASYLVAGQMILDHGIEEVTVLQVSIPYQLERKLRIDPEWEAEPEFGRAYYLEGSIPAHMIRRVLETYSRDDYDRESS